MSVLRAHNCGDHQALYLGLDTPARFGALDGGGCFSPRILDA